jgi:hypothetical protein
LLHLLLLLRSVSLRQRLARCLACGLLLLLLLLLRDWPAAYVASTVVG